MTGLFIGLPQFDIDYHRTGNSVNWTFVGDEAFMVEVATALYLITGHVVHCIGC